MVGCNAIVLLWKATRNRRENTHTQTHCHCRKQPFVARYIYFGSIIECVCFMKERFT